MLCKAHPNVVSYFLKEEDDRFVYLALSYCSLSLGDLYDSEENNIAQLRKISDGDEKPVAHAEAAAEAVAVAPSLAIASRPDSVKAKAAALANEMRLIQQLASGLAHLHALGVLHRDLVRFPFEKTKKRAMFFHSCFPETAQHFA